MRAARISNAPPLTLLSFATFVHAPGITDPSKAYLLEPLDKLEAQYEKKDKKKAAAFGWDVFNQKSLYNAYKKRTANISVDMAQYEAAKEADPEFYREGDSLLYGQAPKVSEEAVDRMVAELNERQKKRKEFSRRRTHYESRDVDSINDRNAHFNKKLERSYGQFTAEIKQNLERGTASRAASHLFPPSAFSSHSCRCVFARAVSSDIPFAYRCLCSPQALPDH